LATEAENVSDENRFRWSRWNWIGLDYVRSFVRFLKLVVTCPTKSEFFCRLLDVFSLQNQLTKCKSMDIGLWIELITKQWRVKLTLWCLGQLHREHHDTSVLFVAIVLSTGARTMHATPHFP